MQGKEGEQCDEQEKAKGSKGSNLFFTREGGDLITAEVDQPLHYF